MKRRRLFWSLAAGGAILLLLLANAYIASQHPMKWLAGRAEASFLREAQRAEAWLGQDSLWAGLSGKGFAHPKAGLLLQESTKFLLFREERLLFWTEDRLGPALSLLDSLQRGATALYRSPSGYYLLKGRVSKDDLLAIAAMPLQGLLPDGLRISQAPTPYPVHDASGTVRFYLSPGPAIPGVLQWPLFLLYALAAAGLLFLLERGGHWLSSCLHPFAGLALALAGSAAISRMAGQISFSGAGYLEGLFRTPAAWGNLAQLAVSSLMAFYLLSFAQRHLKAPRAREQSRPAKISLAGLAYSGIVVSLLALSRVAESLVLESGLRFDFRNVFNLGLLSFTGVASLALFLFCLLLASLWLGRGINRMELSAGQRLLAQAFALLAIVLAHCTAAVSAPMGLLPFLLMALLFLVLLDLFTDRGQPGLAWFTLWLAVLAAFGAVFLFKFSLDDNRRQRLQFAGELAEAQDSLALGQLSKLAAALSRDSQFRQFPTEETADAFVVAAFQLKLADFPYLQKNYQMDLLLPAHPAFREIEAQMDRERKEEDTASHAPWLARTLPPNKGFFWYGIYHNPGPGVAGNPGPMLAAFRPNPRKSERVFQSLIPEGVQHRFGLDYLVFHKSLAVPQRGQFDRAWLAQENWPQGQGWREQLNSQRALLYYRPAEGYDILVKEELGGYIKPLSLFSYFFALLTVLALLVLGANRRLRFLPDTPGVLFWGSHSLRRRIQLSIIGLSLGAFLLIGLITVGYFQNLFASLHQEQLSETVSALARNLQMQGIRGDTTVRLAQLAEVQDADILLYGLDGQLKGGSAPFLFEEKLRATRISPAILAAFRQNNFKPAVAYEQLGGLSFLSAYLAVPGSSGQPAYFLQIPYFSGGSGQQQVLGFIGALLNLYVFLLLIAGATAIAVANSITRPLAVIGEKLRSFKLGKNEALEWERQDEIGKLIAAYNQMAITLEERTEALRQSEREGAWREMAKQVAHEIKNPLTPMKLHIQYLEQTQRTDPERARGMIERVSRMLVEQIDGLARIASEFSDFARMSKANNEQLLLTEVVASVYQLFTEHHDQAEDIRLHLPEQPIYVFADRGHLVRVLTNLIKNAQQAIPEGRRGQIDIRLYQENGAAMISVSDNGSGIPEEVQPRVFQPNFTTKSSGMGLGLAMCKGMVEAAGGTIYFETKAGEGTDFFVELPVV